MSSTTYNFKIMSYDPKIPEGGLRNSRNEWRPSESLAYAPIFTTSTNINKIFKWIFALPGFLWPWNTLYFAIAWFSWAFIQPPLETCKTFQFSWISQVYLRNLCLLWFVYGGWHFYLYTLKARGTYRKYCPRWQSTQGATFLFGNQVYDNIFWCLASACTAWTCYECVTFWAYANGIIPYLDPAKHPVLFVLGFLLIPFWREFHFYWIHRLIHWKPIYNVSHYLHHYNINPGPWSGLAMHPIESIGYFSVVLIHWIIPSHPLHFLFNSQHTALTPAHGHTGFQGSLDEGGKFPFGSYFHYLHHRYFDCNYGESTLPLDKWFGSFMANEESKNNSKAGFQKFLVEKIEAECEGVKSFYFKKEDGGPLVEHQAGQFMTFKFKPHADGKTVLRSYTISDTVQPDRFRISVKKEEHGLVSSFLHHNLKVGEVVEAKGPQGHFVLNPSDKDPLVFLAAGIGITPLYAMLKDLCERESRRSILFILIMKKAKQVPFQQELVQMEKSHSNLRVITFYSQENSSITSQQVKIGRPNMDIIEQVVKSHSSFSLAEHRWLMCGPQTFMEQFTQDLLDKSVPQAQIHKEAFGPGSKQVASASQEKNNAVCVTFKKSNKTIDWTPDSVNLLAFAEENGISMEAGCLFGECGSCKVSLVSGDVTYNYKTALQTEAKSCLPCSCRPTSHVTLDV